VATHSFGRFSSSTSRPRTFSPRSYAFRTSEMLESHYTCMCLCILSILSSQTRQPAAHDPTSIARRSCNLFCVTHPRKYQQNSRRSRARSLRILLYFLCGTHISIASGRIRGEGCQGRNRRLSQAGSFLSIQSAHTDIQLGHGPVLRLHHSFPVIILFTAVHDL
jgi:hypothetical protein